MKFWPFKNQKKGNPELGRNPACPSCGSRDTRLKVNYGNDQPDYIKTWRGQRFLTYHCENCQTDFSLREPAGGFEIESQIKDQIVDDESALTEAEEDLKRAADDEGDHRFG
jgi:hypothetical protein